MVDQPLEPKSSSDKSSARRGKIHKEIAERLEGSSDQELMRVLSSSQIGTQGHASVVLPDTDAEVFIKLLPLTTLELMPENQRSTANIFELPTYYQYRIGSCGFGAWRELAVHHFANEYVLSQQCPGFPLLHHWRVLPIVNRGVDEKAGLDLWGDCPEIHRRVSLITEANSSAVLFLECIPQSLNRWLRDQLTHHPDPFAVVTDLESKLAEQLAFVNAQGLLHMDAHFDNFLTDGEQIVLGDFGLALSREFELDPNEQQFFQKHLNFDLCTAIASLAHAIVTRYNPGDEWRSVLRRVHDGVPLSSEAMPDSIRAYLIRLAPLALTIGEFYDRLLKDLTAPYPTTQLQDLLEAISS